MTVEGCSLGKRVEQVISSQLQAEVVRICSLVLESEPNELYTAVRLHRTWPAQLWGPLGLDSVEAVTVLNTQGRPQPHSQRKLQTNDEALVENKTVASLAGQTDMTPDL